MTGFKLTGLGKSYPNNRLKTQVLQDISLQVDPGSFISIVGPSGCGKSTLLRILAELETPSWGQLQWTMKTPRRALVFQEPNLLPWRNVTENVRLPFDLNPELREGSDLSAKIEEQIKQVHLQRAALLYPHQLSGGMKMRTSIARALIGQPDLLLMDEPFSALDDLTRFDLQIQLRNIWREQKFTLIFVTHTLSEAVFLSNRVLFLREGRFTADLTIHLPEERTEEVRQSAAFNEHLQELMETIRGSR